MVHTNLSRSPQGSRNDSTSWKRCVHQSQGCDIDGVGSLSVGLVFPRDIVGTANGSAIAVRGVALGTGRFLLVCHRYPGRTNFSNNAPSLEQRYRSRSHLYLHQCGQHVFGSQPCLTWVGYCPRQCAAHTRGHLGWTIFSRATIAKSVGRYVTGASWHPPYGGVERFCKI